MNIIPFNENVLSKAKQLKITPKLLIIAIAAIGDNEAVKENYILTRFGKELVLDMKDAAKKQMRVGNSKNMVIAGKYALELSDIQMHNASDKHDFTAPITTQDLLNDGEPLLNIHNVALNYISKELKQIKKQLGTQAKNYSLIDIIKKHCPELIQQFHELAGVMKEDFNYN